MIYTKTISRACLFLLLIMIVPGRLMAQGLQNKSCRMVLNGGVYLVMQDMNLVNNGMMTFGKSKVLFTGKQSTAIDGNNPITFNNVSIGKSFGKTLELQQSIAVTGMLTMDSGNILLNERQLDLGKTGEIAGESSQSYITGTNGGSVLANRIMGIGPATMNPGNIGVELTSYTPLGNIVVERKHVQETMPNGEKSIQRVFAIKRSTNDEVEVNLRFYYLDEELAGNDETGLNIWTDADINNSWILAGNDGGDMALNWVFKKGLNRLGRFTLASTGISTKQTTAKRSVKIQSQPDIVNRLIAYPNPSSDKCTLEFFSQETKQTTLKLYDQQGHLLQQKNIQCIAGMNRIVWDLRQYAAGVYVVTDPAGTMNSKIIKQ